MEKIEGEVVSSRIRSAIRPLPLPPCRVETDSSSLQRRYRQIASLTERAREFAALAFDAALGTAPCFETGCGHPVAVVCVFFDQGLRDTGKPEYGVGTFCEDHIPSRARLVRAGTVLAGGVDACKGLGAALLLERSAEQVALRSISPEALMRLVLRRAIREGFTEETLTETEVQRIAVNVLRHDLSDYDQLIHDDEMPLWLLRSGVYLEIAKRYPDLTAEVLGQLRKRLASQPAESEGGAPETS